MVPSAIGAYSCGPPKVKTSTLTYLENGALASVGCAKTHQTNMIRLLFRHYAPLFISALLTRHSSVFTVNFRNTKLKLILLSQISSNRLAYYINAINISLSFAASNSSLFSKRMPQWNPLIPCMQGKERMPRTFPTSYIFCITLYLDTYFQWSFLLIKVHVGLRFWWIIQAYCPLDLAIPHNLPRTVWAFYKNGINSFHDDAFGSNYDAARNILQQVKICHENNSHVNNPKRIFLNIRLSN